MAHCNSLIMGDLQAWRTPPPPPPPPQPPTSNLQLAEAAAHEVIECIQPTVASENRRKAVVEYVQNLIRESLGCEVFPLGSVPLKTYLPDGDIDLTALTFAGNSPSVDAFAHEVVLVLAAQERSATAKFHVTDVEYIHAAEVKLVKCVIDDIVMDVSFNQVGGISTLCFLERVDRHVGKAHLFKRSVMLVKAWCYYEGRILGAHCGLISTYALETMVLYVLHRFHSSSDGPLAVLHRFLDYYSRFDWDSYCLSLHGPLSLSSLLPGLLVVDDSLHHNEGGGLLLTAQFLQECLYLFSVPSKTSVSDFPRKHLNIVDPLMENNNLGRSISQTNFYRIRSAFACGAKELGRILVLPSDRVADEVSMFFANVVDRHGSTCLANSQATAECLLAGESEDGGVPNKLCDLSGNYDTYTAVLLYAHWIEDCISGASARTDANGVAPPSASDASDITSKEEEEGDDQEKSRYGTGTYIPDYGSTYWKWHSLRMGKQWKSVQQETSPDDTNYFQEEKSSLRPHEQLQKQQQQQQHPVTVEASSNGSVSPGYDTIVFGSLGPVLLGAAPMQSVPVNRPSTGSDHENSAKTYELKDEVDFPPLSGCLQFQKYSVRH